ncbi:histone-fold-containing protein [Thozetella sp. PMI_491]|nr:histone-fold-containing protein [Thozetella sp. PMI_491]
MARLKTVKSKARRPQVPSQTVSQIEEVKPKSKPRRRAKSGTVALREIKKYQQSTKKLLPKRPFRRLVEEVAGECVPHLPRLRWKRKALLALQEIAEDYLARLFAKANKAALHAGRITISENDMRLVRDLEANN